MIITPLITAEKVITVPIERSIPAVMITNVTPNARTPLTESHRHLSNIIALFPFNCFGNLARPKVALDAVAFTGASIVVSTYRTDQRATELRLEYYSKCRYSRLTHETLACGNVIRSAEGLCTYAYSQEHLQRLFESANYRLQTSGRLGNIGVGYCFAPMDAARPENAYPAYQQSRDQDPKGPDP